MQINSVYNTSNKGKLLVTVSENSDVNKITLP
jgi:hypothetical protein